MYNLYRRLIEARRRSEALKSGRIIHSAEGDVLLYVRAFGSKRILVILTWELLPWRLFRLRQEESCLYPHPESAKANSST